MNGTYGGRGSLRSLLLVLVAPASVMVEKNFPGGMDRKTTCCIPFYGIQQVAL